MPLAATHTGNFLFASTYDDEHDPELHWIDAFKRDPQSGKLNWLGSVETVGRLTHISVDKTNRFLLGASYFANCIVVHFIKSDGTLSEPKFTMPTGRNAHHILTDATNRYAFVPNLGDSKVLQLAFDDRTGRFTPNQPSEVKQPRGLVAAISRFIPTSGSSIW